jgi:hypothetical protein
MTTTLLSKGLDDVYKNVSVKQVGLTFNLTPGDFFLAAHIEVIEIGGYGTTTFICKHAILPFEYQKCVPVYSTSGEYPISVSTNIDINPMGDSNSPVEVELAA